MGKGNHKFRFSDMMPNAWFYKLKDMTKSSSSSRQTQTSKNNSKIKNNIVSSTSLPPTYYNFSQHKHFPNPTLTVKPASVSASSRDAQFESPRRSSTFRKRYRRRTIYRPSPRPAVFSSDTDSSSQSEFYKPFSKNEEEDDAAASSGSEFSDGHGQGQAPCSCSRVSRRDIIIDMKEQKQQHEHQAFPTAKTTTTTTTTTASTNAAAKPRLPPIITKPASKQNHASGPSPKLHGIKPVHNLKSGDDKAKSNKNPATLRRTTVAPPNNSTNSNTTGIRIRANSPRIASRKNLHSRKSVSSPAPSSSSSLSVKFRNKNLAESLAVVKSSVDPESDFRASMAEMIKENKISASNSKDLEDLLACYLSLNSRIYHNHIVKAFEQIWFDITHSPGN